MLMKTRTEPVDDQQATLDDLLSRWHSWSKNYKANQQAPSDPIFRDAKSGRGWDSTDDIIEDEVLSSQMEAIEFQVSEMRDPYKAAIYVLARNLSTGRNVWISPRLPQEPMERGRVVAEARAMLSKRLRACGVIE